MRRFLVPLIPFLLLLPLAHAQWNVNTGGLPIRSGGALPSTCAPDGTLFFKNSATKGWYFCRSGALVAFGTGSGSGTVSSVTFTGDGVVLSSTPSAAVTTSGTLPATLANAGANTVLGNATGSPAAPAYNQLINAQITNGTIDLTTKVTGVLPGANGGSSTVNTADQGYLVGANLPLFGVTYSTQGIVGGANEVRTVQFINPARITINKVTMSIGAAGAGGTTVTGGLYSCDGTTKLLDSGTFNGASATVQTNTLGAAVTLAAGQCVILAWTASTTTTLTVISAPAMTAVFGSILNAQTIKKVGSAANAAVSGVLPNTLGTITAVSNGDIPVELFLP